MESSIILFEVGNQFKDKEELKKACQILTTRRNFE